jgi:uncharacterized membrane protein YphA (DoxX/SURF4 family)
MNAEAMNAEVSSISALGRPLIALIFIRAGINKLGSVAATAANAEPRHPFSRYLGLGCHSTRTGRAA